MSILQRIPDDEVFRRFTHNGWLGLCPVWLNERSSAVCERNWVPGWWCDLNIFAVDLVGLARDMLGCEPWDGWPILQTGRIGHGAKR